MRIVSYGIIFFLLPLPSVHQALFPCPVGCTTGYAEWVQGKCYRKTSTAQNYADSITACRSDGGYLVIIDNAVENTAIFAQMLGDSVWIGVNDMAIEGVYVNTFGALQLYLPWTTGEPNNANNPPGENCINMWAAGQVMPFLAQAGKWNDDACTNSYKAICQHACEIVPGACSSNPCVNGNCTNGILDKYTCTCPAGYTGQKCDTDIDDCNPNPCQNNGVCTDGFNSYNCTCLEAFSGTNCEVKLTNCDLQTSEEQKQHVAMFASQSVSSITFIVIVGILIILFLILREFSLARVLHMGQEISIWLAQITVLFARTRTVLDTGAFCNDEASGNPPKLNDLGCGLVAVWLHYIYLVHFVFLFVEALHNYTLYTYVFVLKPMLARRIILLIGILGPLPVVALTAGIWFHTYVTEQTCWLNFDSPNFYIEVIPALAMCAIGVICAEATGMVEYEPNILAKEEQRWTANINSKGSICIISISVSAWLLGMAAVYSTNLTLYTIVSVLNIILAILLLFFHTLGNAKAEWWLWKIFCSWCPKQKPREKPTSNLPAKFLNRKKALLNDEKTQSKPLRNDNDDTLNSLNNLPNSKNSKIYERKSSLIAIVEEADRRVNEISPTRPNSKTLYGRTRKN